MNFRRYVNDAFAPSINEARELLGLIAQLLFEAGPIPDDFHRKILGDIEKRSERIRQDIELRAQDTLGQPQVSRTPPGQEAGHHDVVDVSPSGKPTIKVKIPYNDKDDAGFCMANSSIRKFILDSPDNFAALLIFVFASMGKSWHDLHVDFPLIMHWYQTLGYFPTSKPYAEKQFKPNARFKVTDADGVERLSMPINIMKRFVGRRGMETMRSCNYVWQNRKQLWNRFKPLIAEYDQRAKAEDEAATTDLAVDIYAHFLEIPGLGLPKAGFATQLAIGRFGCIDSINTTLYAGVSGLQLAKEYPGMIAGGGKAAAKSAFAFAPVKPRKNAEGQGYKGLTPASKQTLDMYIRFLRDVKRETQNSESQQLWADWCKLVASKIWLPHIMKKSINMNVDFPLRGSGTVTRGMEAYKYGPTSGATMEKTLEELEKLRTSEFDTLAKLIGLDHHATMATKGDPHAVSAEEIARKIERQLAIVQQMRDYEEKGPPRSMIDVEGTKKVKARRQTELERTQRKMRSIQDEEQNESSANTNSGTIADFAGEYPHGVTRFMALANVLLQQGAKTKAVVSRSAKEGRKTQKASAKYMKTIVEKGRKKFRSR